MTKMPRISTKLIIKMNENFYAGIEKIYGKDRFKKIKFSPDSTDLMSDFSDK